MANGGKRPGAGRKPGSKSATTLKKEKVLAALRQRIMENVDRIFGSQLSIAQGQRFLFKIEKERIVGPKGGISYRSMKPELVTNEVEIQNYLDGLVEEGDMDDERDPGATYYYITTKEPNNMAIDSMLNRAFGKPTETHEISGKDGNPIEAKVIILPERK
jgi:hypothetical protein